MSHLKERKEKICLNCNTELHGFYCHVCGQENIEPKQSAWHLISHFFYDITHFDGKFFTTVKDLLIKPGFLSREFINGRRISYLHPIRMYIFTSAIFFIIFFSVFNIKQMPGNVNITFKEKDLRKVEQEALQGAKNKADSDAIKKSLQGLKKFPLIPKIDSASSEKDDDFTLKGADGKLYKSTDQYDSVQLTLPAALRDGWMRKHIAHKRIELNEKYKGNKSAFFADWIEAFFHDFPKILFVSLPIFALLLKLIYIRRKQFYYADHGIFAIHMYIYAFIAMLFVFAFRYLAQLSGWSWLWIFNAAIFLYTIYYFYKAMRNFYQQGRVKTFLKYIILYFLTVVALGILFSLFFIFSILQI